MDVRHEDERVEYVPLAELRPYDGNAKRHTHEQIDALENSIKEFGFRNPILVWDNEDGEPEIVAGHARAIAARNLGMETVPIIRVDDLSDAQRRALTLVDNQTTMMTGWDADQLSYELDILADDFDMSEFGFDLSDGDDDEEYTSLVKGLIYEPSGVTPSLGSLVDTSERDRLFDMVMGAECVTDAEKDFLTEACQRFLAFDYAAIADYYANGTEPMRRIMRELRLVIVDEGARMEHAAEDFAAEVAEAYTEPDNA